MAWTEEAWPSRDELRRRAAVNGTGWSLPRVVYAHHAALARAAARDRRIRDEDLALDGRPRLHGDNMTSVPMWDERKRR